MEIIAMQQSYKLFLEQQERSGRRHPYVAAGVFAMTSMT